MKSAIPLLLAATLLVALSTSATATERSILLQSTTSTKNSGFYDHILPLFKADSGITVHVVAVGTGQAIKNARNCDADVLLVHAEADEKNFVARGFGVKRHRLMYNDFVIVGPSSDPAKISNFKTAPAALTRIAQTETLFVSRGDSSGTHKREQALWRSTGINAVAASGEWYRETGSGMGATLNAAVAMSAYALTDRATWIAFRNKQGFKIHVDGGKALLNQYAVILVNKARCPANKAKAGQRFVDWLTSTAGQAAIQRFRKNGQQLFFPNAVKN
jgi:tungstate transport system substrate-binding protein